MVAHGCVLFCDAGKSVTRDDLLANTGAISGTSFAREHVLGRVTAMEAGSSVCAGFPLWRINDDSLWWLVPSFISLVSHLQQVSGGGGIPEGSFGAGSKFGLL